MSKLAKIAVPLGFVLFVAFVIYSSLGLGTHSCTVCMEHNGLTECATASGTAVFEARQTAITTACATISAGVTDSIDCQDTPPKSVDCDE